MIAYIALGISVFDLLLWIVFAIGIRKVFLRLLPMFQMMGISPTQNLTDHGIYDKIEVPPELGDAESEQ